MDEEQIIKSKDIGIIELNIYPDKPVSYRDNIVLRDVKIGDMHYGVSELGEYLSIFFEKNSYLILCGKNIVKSIENIKNIRCCKVV